MKTLITALTLTLAALAVTAAPAPKPNIVYFLVDDMGFSDVGFNGSTEINTPNMDALAMQGAVLRDHYVQPVCSPTRAALLTGRYPTHTGVFTIFGPSDKAGLPLAERTLAVALRQAGYTTAICGKWHLGDFDPAYTPTRRGFDHQYGLWGGSINYYTHVKQGALDWHLNDALLDTSGYSTHLLAQDAANVINSQPAGKPLFLYMPFNAVHSPYQVPDSYKAPYPNLSDKRRTMAALVSSVDEAIGQVVAALKQKGIFNNTLIIFSSDNGGVFPGKYTDNTPLRAGKGSIYDGGVRVCAFASWPGQIPANTEIQEPIHVVDWYPTLVKLAGGSLQQALPIDGRDIWPVLTQGAKSPHSALLLAGRSKTEAAVRMGNWKLLLNPSDQDSETGGTPLPPGTELVELYNLKNDISEKNNLAASNPARVQKMRAQLNSFLNGDFEP